MDDEESVNVAELLTDVQKTINLNAKAMRILESLTPGGSEFHNSPANCERWISGQKAMAHGIIQRKINRINELEDWLANLVDVLCTCDDLLPSQSAVDPTGHDEQCPYRQKAERKE
jgi:hypothetical protein